MGLKGSLNATPFSAVLEALAAQSATGLLRVNVPTSSHFLEFADGGVTAASRTSTRNPLGELLIDADLGEADRSHFHFGEIGSTPSGLVTSGVYGWTMVVTAVALTLVEAKAQAYARLGRVTIPQARYRLDIGDRLIAHDLAAIERLGLFGKG